jgi:hypothetical protein
MFTIDNHELVLIDTDVVTRVKEPNLDLVITVLRTDGATLAADQTGALPVAVPETQTARPASPPPAIAGTTCKTSGQQRTSVGAL